MKISRRNFIAGGARTAAGLAGMPLFAQQVRNAGGNDGVTQEALEAAASRPVLDVSTIKEPIIIESLELLRRERRYFVRVRSKDGAEGVSIDNGRADVLHPIFNKLIAPYFIGKDARELEEHLFQVYRLRDNYKFQGLPLWCPVALVEFAILDMLGRIAGKPMGQLLGTKVRDLVPFYIASGKRDTTPAQEIDYLKGLIEKTGAKAVKYRVGGRMSRNEDAMPGRTETLIPLTRKELGDKIAIHADANSSYDAEHAIPVGRLLEEINAEYFEEPCPFDDFYETKKVKDALKIPIALGEQESSHARFRECIAERVADIIQPDLFYYGGLIRSIRVSKMADLRGLPTTVHISGGFGFVYMLHFTSVVQSIGDWQEYKDGVAEYGDWFDPPLKIVDGALTVPTGPGVGIVDPKEVLKGTEVVPA